MKNLFKNSWVQLAFVTVVAFAAGLNTYVGVVAWAVYFVLWCNDMYNQWVEKSRK